MHPDTTSVELKYDKFTEIHCLIGRQWVPVSLEYFFYNFNGILL